MLKALILALFVSAVTATYHRWNFQDTFTLSQACPTNGNDYTCSLKFRGNVITSMIKHNALSTTVTYMFGNTFIFNITSGTNQAGNSCTETGTVYLMEGVPTNTLYAFNFKSVWCQQNPPASVYVINGGQGPWASATGQLALICNPATGICHNTGWINDANPTTTTSADQ